MTVIVPDAASLGRIHELARRSEAALATAAEFFDAPAPDVTVVVQGDDDVYNAWVDPLGGPVVTVPLQPPWPGEVGSSAPDPLQLLLVHEMIHAVHFGGRPGSLPVRTGVVGADLPWPPPMWLLEGMAVWAESRAVPGGGGRLDDPDARSVIRALAVDDAWPSLADAARLPSEAWPGGRTRYLLGGAFVEHLIQGAGLPALRDALRRFETAPPWTGFDDAWRHTVGGDLQLEWAALRDRLRAEASALDDEVGRLLVGEPAPDTPPPSASDRSSDRSPARSPAWSPDGTRLGWLEGRTVRVATVGPDGELAETVAVQLRSTPGRLAWRGAAELVYVRLRDGPAGRLGELHELSLATGAERRLTRGARAHAAVPLADGCLAFVRDDGLGASQLRRWCDGGPEAGVDAWSAPAGARIVSLAASPAGRVAAILDRSGERSVVGWSRPDGSTPWREPDPIPIALDGALRGLAWEGESHLWLVSAVDADRTGAWRVELATGRAELWAAPRFGVVDLTRGVVAVRRAGGPVLARVAGAPLRTVASPRGSASPERGGRPPAGPEPAGPESAGLEPAGSASARIASRGWDVGVPDGAAGPRPYDPRAGLRLLGWLPSDLGVGGAGVRLVAIDPTRRYAIDAVAGRVPGGDGAWGRPAFGASLRVGRAGIVPTPGRRDPATAVFGIGLLPFAPHRAPPEPPRPQLDVGVDATLAWEPTVRLGARLVTRVADAGAVRTGGSVRIASSDGAADGWGVPRRGWAAALTGRTDPIAGGRSSGVWLDAAAWIPTGLPGAPTADASIRTGWRPPAPVPTRAFANVAASGSAGLGWTVPVGVTIADGRWALHRVRFAPRLRLGVSTGAYDGDGASGDGTGDVAADVTAAAASDSADAGLAAAVGVEGLVAADLVLGYGATASLELEGGVSWRGGGRGPEAWLRWSVPGLP